MIKKTVPHTDIPVIPIVWKKWFALLRGIKEKIIEIEEYEEKPDEYTPVGLKDVMDNLVFESRQSIGGFPLDIYKMERPEDALLILRAAAEKIDAEYKAALPCIKNFSEVTQDRFGNIQKECKVVCQIIDSYYREVSKGIKKEMYYPTDDDGQVLSVLPDYFDEKRIRLLFSIVNGYCIEKLSIDTFVELLNSDETLWDRRYFAYEGTSSRIFPVADHELSFYTLLVVLMLGRNQYQDEYSFMSNGIDADDYEINTRWANKCTHLIKWQSPNEPESDYSWVDELKTEEWDNCYWDAETLKYVYYESPSDPTGISDADRTELMKLVGRPVFDEICSNESLVNHSFKLYECDERHIQRCLAEVSENRKEHFCYWLKLLVNETNYLLLSKDAFCNQFISEDGYQETIRMNDFQFEVYTGLIDDLNDYFDGGDLNRYSHPNPGDGFNPVIHIIDRLNSYTHFVRLSCKPEIHDRIIGRIIDSCIDFNIVVKKVLREAIEDEHLISIISPCSSTNAPEQGRTQEINPSSSASSSHSQDIDGICNSLISSGIIDQNRNVIVPKADFARILVKRRIVKADVPYTRLFSYNHLSYNNGSQELKPEEIKELTQSLKWKHLDNVFNKNGVPLSSYALRKAFSDGDQDGSKRNIVFFSLFKSSKPKA